MYREGKGVAQDDAQAVKWWRLAAKGGHDRAQFLLGSMYALGQGVAQDDRIAYMWLNVAYARGFEAAKEIRDIVEKRLTPAQQAEAVEMARRCRALFYIGCFN